MQVKGENKEVQVKRLPKRPTPPRFGRKLTAAQRELATHICVDCGWIYCAKCAPALYCSQYTDSSAQAACSVDTVVQSKRFNLT